MNAIEEVKKSLYESYKWMYEDAIAAMKEDLRLAKERREWGKMGWAAEWLNSANIQYKLARGYKRSMKFYAS